MIRANVQGMSYVTGPAHMSARLQTIFRGKAGATFAPYIKGSYDTGGKDNGMKVLGGGFKLSMPLVAFGKILKKVFSRKSV